MSVVTSHTWEVAELGFSPCLLGSKSQGTWFLFPQLECLQLQGEV